MVVRKDFTKVYLMITTGIFAAAGVLGFLPSMMAFMLFDAPGSENNPVIVTLFWAMVTFPVVCGLSVILSWYLYRVRQYFLACGVALLPLVNVIVGFAAIQIQSGGP